MHVRVINKPLKYGNTIYQPGDTLKVKDKEHTVLSALKRVRYEPTDEGFSLGFDGKPKPKYRRTKKPATFDTEK